MAVNALLLQVTLFYQQIPVTPVYQANINEELYPNYSYIVPCLSINQ